MNENPRITHQAPNVTLATWREVFVSVWRAVGTVNDVRTQYAQQRQHAQKLGSEKVIAISVVQSRAAMSLDADVRRAIEEGTKTTQEHMKASAVIITADGFGAAAIRSVIAALMMLNRPKFPTQVFGNDDEACAWAGGFLTNVTRGGASPAAALRTALRDVVTSQA